MHIVCTVCSREKLPTRDWVPAWRLYRGKHIEEVYDIAKKLGLQFYIFSGKYGLLWSQEFVCPYDHRLEACEVAGLAQTSAEKLKHWGVTSLSLYAEFKPSWTLYRQAVRSAAELASIGFKETELPLVKRAA